MEQLEFKLEKIIGIQKHAGKVRKLLYLEVSIYASVWLENSITKLTHYVSSFGAVHEKTWYWTDFSELFPIVSLIFYQIIFIEISSVLSSYIFSLFFLKVSKFQNQIFLFSFAPINERNYFLIPALVSKLGRIEKMKTLFKIN